jgi:hypothetical protein
VYLEGETFISEAGVTSSTFKAVPDVPVLVAVGELCDHGSPGGRGSSDGQGSPGTRGSNPSNRQIADAAGIRDQGQISKLLARLEQLGLARNTAGGRVKGEPNAWALTERGEAVRAVMARSQHVEALSLPP